MKSGDLANDSEVELFELEQEQAYDPGDNKVPPQDIVAFNELRSCFDLVRLHTNKKLDIQPEYQREEVWKNSDKTRFIDSLSKELPIPSMCIAHDFKRDKRFVVDGLQRMSSIISFLNDDNWALSTLEDIDARLSGKAVSDIKINHSDLYHRIEDVTIPVTVLRCDLEKESHKKYLFSIFHRLNSGGVKLTAQEIRNCIYQGPLNTLLQKFARSDKAKGLFEISDNKKTRFMYEELLLRGLAHSSFNGYEKYKGPLTKYLNNFMEKHDKCKDCDVSKLSDDLEFSIDFIYDNILKKEPINKSKAIVEAVFVGVIRNKNTIVKLSDDDVHTRYKTLLEDDLFGTEALKEGLAAPEKLKSRLKRAEEIFRS